MEIPVINRIVDFDAAMGSLQSPSHHISQTLFVAGIVTVSKWTPLLILALAGLVSTVKLFVIRLRSLKPLLHSQQPLLDYDSDADTASSSDDEEDDERQEEEEAEVDDCWRRVEDDFQVRGSGYSIGEQWQSRKLWLRHRRSIGDLFSWPDLAAGKSVVKLWDDMDLGFDLLNDSHDSGSGNVISVVSPPVVISAAGSNGSRSIGVKVWDRRVSCRVPAILAEWRSQSKEIANYNVFGTGEVTVGDIRKVKTALENVTEWDADTVMVTDGVFDRLAGERCNLPVTRCCDAVRSHLLLSNGN